MKRGFTLVEFVLVIAIIGILAAVGMPRFFNPDTFENANERTAFQSALNLVRNRAITAQCAFEVRIDTSGWSAWRDYASNCDSSLPVPACDTMPTVALVDANGDPLTGALALPTGSATPLVRLVFTARGRVHLLTPPCDGTLDTNNQPSFDTIVPLANSTVLHLDGVTGYASLQ